MRRALFCARLSKSVVAASGAKAPFGGALYVRAKAHTYNAAPKPQLQNCNFKLQLQNCNFKLQLQNCNFKLQLQNCNFKLQLQNPQLQNPHPLKSAKGAAPTLGSWRLDNSKILIIIFRLRPACGRPGPLRRLSSSTIPRGARWRDSVRRCDCESVCNRRLWPPAAGLPRLR